MKVILRSVDPELDIHVILDNYATHKHPKVRQWLARHPRFVFHFTPTSAYGSMRWKRSFPGSHDDA
jgi:hypothetical protein